MPPPPPKALPPGAEEPTVWSKLKMGATMGTMVGLTIGFLFGSFAILRNGAGPRGFLPSLSTYMLSSAATFGFFMSIGTVIRTDGLTMREWAEMEIAKPNAIAAPPIPSSSSSWGMKGEMNKLGTSSVFSKRFMGPRLGLEQRMSLVSDWESRRGKGML
ncbi:BQ2448_4285 [Microbotryum intermedium]|uniref:BQ2448_4285 protein n=1 Tax=Microbotryum intermedium TaxID=269621 RepID=A0A238FNH0_9BASI|nr:BQ2448_4285 [Microbotryum intermedium]